MKPRHLLLLGAIYFVFDIMPGFFKATGTIPVYGPAYDYLSYIRLIPLLAAFATGVFLGHKAVLSVALLGAPVRLVIEFMLILTDGLNLSEGQTGLLVGLMWMPVEFVLRGWLSGSAAWIGARIGASGLGFSTILLLVLFATLSIPIFIFISAQQYLSRDFPAIVFLTVLSFVLTGVVATRLKAKFHRHPDST